MAADGIFLDTNILVYASWSGSPRHLDARNALLQLEEQEAVLWISPQVLREYLAVVTRPQGDLVPMTVSEAGHSVRAFLQLFRVAGEGPDVVLRLLAVVEQFGVKGKEVHDANIVSTMLSHGVPRILTANARDFHRYGDLIRVEAL